jgi:hypothetical protein
MGWSDPQTILTTIIAVSAFLYTVLTAFIWHATWQNTKATRTVLEIAHRPYVGVTGVDIKSLTHESASLIVTVSNIGSVPARIINLKVVLPAISSEPRKPMDLLRTVALLPEKSIGFIEDFYGADARRLRSPGFEVLMDLRYESMGGAQHTSTSAHEYSPPDNSFRISESKMD